VNEGDITGNAVASRTSLFNTWGSNHDALVDCTYQNMSIFIRYLGDEHVSEFGVYENSKLRWSIRIGLNGWFGCA
jgi:hypothetical protein